MPLAQQFLANSVFRSQIYLAIFLAVQENMSYFLYHPQ